MGDELTVLNAHNRLEVQAPHDRREIQIVYLVELSRSQPMVAVLASSVVRGAERHG
jgi:hypothetical protein